MSQEWHQGVDVLSPVTETETGRPGRTDDSVNVSTHSDYFETCEKNRSLLNDIAVVVPVRPNDGMNCALSRMLSIWYGEGTGWSQLNDHMGGFVEVTRANIAHDFVHNRTERFLLMIDNDMEPPLDLPYLLARHDLPVVGAPAMSISKEYGPQLCFTIQDENGDWRFPAMRNGKIPARGVKECAHVGTGAILIRRDVLEAFTFQAGDIPFYVPENIRMKGAATGHLLVGEDIAFCNQVRDKGFACHVDLEAHCGHRKTVCMIWDEDLRDPGLDSEGWKVPSTGSQKFRVGFEEYA